MRELNCAVDALVRVLVDQHDVGLAGALVTKRAQPGLGCVGDNRLQPNARQHARYIGKRSRCKFTQFNHAIRVVKRARHFIDGEDHNARRHHAPYGLRRRRANK